MPARLGELIGSAWRCANGSAGREFAESRWRSPVPAVLPLTLAASSSGTNAFAGSLDELAIYDKALTSDRVVAHYNAGQGLFP